MKSNKPVLTVVLADGAGLGTALEHHDAVEAVLATPLPRLQFARALGCLAALARALPLRREGGVVGGGEPWRRIRREAGTKIYTAQGDITEGRLE